MSSLLIAESGSTKTDWCFLNKGHKPVHFKTSGINPYLQTQEDIFSVLENELPWDGEVYKAGAICYYGAGAARKDKQLQMAQILKNYFGINKVEVQGDMMAAARALCGDKKGIICIIGTGSASCYYNGSIIKEQKASLGYIAGDEGSGNHMGKRVLQYYAYNTFDTELKMDFEQRFGADFSEIMNNLYHKPFPNRYLATFVQLLKANRGHFMVENIIEDTLSDFFHHNILKYRQSWKLPLYFTGSVAYEFQDVIANLCHQYELEIGVIEKSPMDGLIKYYQRTMN